ncbi:GTPase activating factor [Elasticomyces elasticus]|nr:GTPase activating factor [Elasticomyces elasticus]
MESDRQRWTQERRRKQPSLYDEYLNQEKAKAPAPRRSATPIQERTIRAVTPESIPEGVATDARSFERGFFVTSPPSSPHSMRKSPKVNLRGSHLRTSSGDSKDYSKNSSTSAHTRSRTKTHEERRRESPPPPSALLKKRHRVSSVHSPAYLVLDGTEEDGSIGRRPTVSPLSQSSFSSAASLHPDTSLSPRSVSPLSPTGSHAESVASSETATNNGRRIFHLMKTLCGRMSGNLAFRRGSTNTWTLSYCYIEEETGSLLYEPKVDTSYHKTLVPDLRGCQVKPAFDDDAQSPYLDISLPNSGLEVHIRLQNQADFDSWYAALLCWQPIRPKGVLNKMPKPQAPVVPSRPRNETRRHSGVGLLKEAPIIKVGKMIFWSTDVSYSNAQTPKALRPRAHRMQSFRSRRWRRISCTLRENGELKLYSDGEVATLLSVVQLSQLSRCAIQRLDPSVLDNEFCIAIYPQYTSGLSTIPLLRPVFLSLETRVLYEVWYVLLRAFTIPQLYGPEQHTSEEDDFSAPRVAEEKLATSTTGMFRMERMFSIRIIEAKMLPPSPSGTSESHNHRYAPPKADALGGYFVEILLDGETRAKTAVKHEGLNPFWREDFEFLDLPTVLSSASVFVKRRPPDTSSERERQDYNFFHEAYGLPDNEGGYSGITLDQTCGKVEIYLDELEACKEIEKWWPVANSNGQRVGEILIKARAEEGVILMAKDYQPLADLLHRFSNGLTLQIAQMVAVELKRLSECLLNIFQVSGRVGDWLMALVEEEIDGIHKESPVTRLRYSRRVSSNDSNDSFGTGSDRELIVRDMNKNAALEANLLFRGNTLLTKSLDSHMRRVGKEYLEETLSDMMREINDTDPDCEVDPNRATPHELDKNWKRLLQLTQDVWRAIVDSASRCPVELKVIFRHIRACAEDRYGDFLRSVKYSSVSGFLFLRFFCPAALNPKLFGLLKEDDPKPRARRTFTLIAKSLQGLANMSTFGSKEHWMEPMNQFLYGHREEFKQFIDSVCSIPSHYIMPEVQPSYSTPLAISSRLPPTSQEGFPSLPYLIDHARHYAELVTLWLENTTQSATSIQRTDGDLLAFHNTCVTLQAQTHECLSRAERAERPNSSLSFRWEELIEQLQSATQLDTSTTESYLDLAGHTAPGGPTLPALPAFSHKHSLSVPLPGRHAEGKISTASSLASLLVPPDLATTPAYDDTPPGSASMDGNSRTDTLGTRSLSGSLHGSVKGSLHDASNVSSTVNSDAEHTTALPSLVRERAKRERRRKLERPDREKAREKDRPNLKDLVPSLRKKRAK